MKVLLFNGSNREHGCTFTALSEAARILNEEGVETEILQIGAAPVADCIGCRVCAKTNRCVFQNDCVNDWIEKAKTADGFIFGTPVYFAHPSGRILSALDRMFYAARGCFEHKPAAVVASARRGGTTASFDVLNKYPSISQMPIVSSTYWNIVHGSLPEETKKDEEGIWRMDFEDMDAKIKANHIHVAIFCSPHNPCGRVWERWELEKAMEVYRANDCLVISDEIWSDIILNGHKHIPTQSVSEDARSRTVALYAPSKTFNLAGLVGSYHIIYNPYLRDRVRAKSSKPHYNDMNVLSMHALIGAYKPEGYEWVEELRETISGNVNFACDYITQHFEGVSVSKPEGTYMLFLDCTDWCKAHGKTIAEVEKAGWNVGVAWQDGRMFHGPCAIRMNLALPLTRVQEAFERLDKYVFNGEWV